MSPVKLAPYPAYDVRKIINCLRYPKDDLVNILCHRGLHLQLGSTENSFASTANAARAGWEGIEIDLRLTRDGQVLVFHDDGLGRTTDIQPPAGELSRNPFTGRGYNPLVEDNDWFGTIEHLHLKDNLGAVTSEHPIRLQDLLQFITDEGINLVLHLDIKEEVVLRESYAIISTFSNATGIPAMEWCIWKPRSDMFPSPAEWEAQPWVQRALKSGQGMAYTPLYEKEDVHTIDSVKGWLSRDYLVTIEMHVPKPGGENQGPLDYCKAQAQTEEGSRIGIGSWFIVGDLPREYYDETVECIYDDSAYRQAILQSGLDVPVHFMEKGGIKAIGGVLGQKRSDEQFDGRTRLEYLVEQGFTNLTADPFDDLSERLAKMGKRNVQWMMQS